MTADIRPGMGYIPTILFRDSAGSLVTGTTTGTKIGSLYGPSGTVLTTGGVTHQGGGRWGFYVAPSFLTAIGTYKFVVDQIVSGADSLVNAVATFEVGYDIAWTLREMYTRIREDLGDGWVGTTTGNGSTTTLIDSRFAYGAQSDWLSSEIFFFEPGAVGDANPVRVTIFANSGLFTVTPAITSTVAGQDFIVGNKNGTGWRHEQIMGAILLAVRRCGSGAMLTDEDSLTYSTTVAEYVAPAQFAEVTGLAFQPSGADTGAWVPIAKGRYWMWEADRRRVVMLRRTTGLATWGSPYPATTRGYGYDIPQGAKLRLTGRAVLQLPSLMGEAIDADGQRVYDLAMMHLLMQRKEPEHRQRAAMVAGTMGRPPIRMPG